MLLSNIVFPKKARIISTKNKDVLKSLFNNLKSVAYLRQALQEDIYCRPESGDLTQGISSS